MRSNYNLESKVIDFIFFFTTKWILVLGILDLGLKKKFKSLLKKHDDLLQPGFSFH
jgi:hypothetical protein